MIIITIIITIIMKKIIVNAKSLLISYFRNLQMNNYKKKKIKIMIEHINK